MLQARAPDVPCMDSCGASSSGSTSSSSGNRLERVVREALAAHGDRTCSNCGVKGNPMVPLKACTGCKQAYYCGRPCQRAHWSLHKKACREAQARAEKQQKQKQQEKLDKRADVGEKDQGAGSSCGSGSMAATS